MAKKLIFILLALLLSGGGAALYFVLAPRATEAAATATGPAVPEAPGRFVELDPLTLPVMRGGVVRRLITFSITLELAPGRSDADIQASLPRIENALVTELQGLLSIEWPGDAALDIDHAKRRLLARFARLLGQGVVERLLVQHIQERRV